jgi:hypothetical protein
MKATSSPKAKLDKSLYFLKVAQAGHVAMELNGKKEELDSDLQWEIWRTCREIAVTEGNRLGGMLAGPALAALKAAATRARLNLAGKL